MMHTIRNLQERQTSTSTYQAHPIKGDHNNNKMERLNGEICDREKTMRGIKKMDTPILTGYQLYHNYISTHEGLAGKTPAEVAGIRIEGKNKWITIIQNASKFQK
jgi:putative transposase